MQRRDFLRQSAVCGVALGLGAALPALAYDAADAALVAGTLAVTSDKVNVRGGPGVDQPLVATLDGGTSVDLLAASADAAWWRVASDSLVGYVSADLLQPTGQASPGEVFDLDLSLPYSRQLTAVWCDPADIEMWRHYRQGDQGGPNRATQSAIWDWETTHNAGFTVDQWDCSPFAVASAAHQWMPSAGFDHFIYDDPLAGSRTLAWLLANQNYREPSIALIWQGLHYVLVRGVRSIGDPARDPQNVQLLGFYVADPDATANFWLGQDRFIPIDRWLNELFTPVSYLTPHTGVPGDVWQNRIVAIQRASTTGGPSQPGQRNASPSSYS